jgi:hypothetical protein
MELDNIELKPGMLVKTEQTGWGYLIPDKGGTLCVACCALDCFLWPVDNCILEAVYATQFLGGRRDIIGGAE